MSVAPFIDEGPEDIMAHLGAAIGVCVLSTVVLVAYSFVMRRRSPKAEDVTVADIEMVSRTYAETTSNIRSPPTSPRLADIHSKCVALMKRYAPEKVDNIQRALDGPYKGREDALLDDLTKKYAL